jgi:hypothetical protein
MCASIVLAVACSVAPARAQDRQSGVQITPDTKRVLISKDVSGQRWAITRNLSDGSVTGNVYLPEGGDPIFLFCKLVSGTVETVELSCYGASSCLASPCGGTYFSHIADVSLPQAFFAPPGGAPGAGATTRNDIATLGGAADDRRSGLQITPDELRTLISKDVGGQRWAITRNSDDDTVTGNVYQADGGEPLFLYCTQTDGNGPTVGLSCSGAGRCVAAPCSPSDFTFIADVELSRAFFVPPDGPAPTPPPTCGNGVVDRPAEDCDGSNLGDLDCSDALLAFGDCTGTLACGSDCKLDATACSCTCDGDIDCGWPVDCGAFAASCQLLGACEAGRCVNATAGTSEICTGSDPAVPGVPRTEQCELP